jgi:hypothetical protein
VNYPGEHVVRREDEQSVYSDPWGGTYGTPPPSEDLEIISMGANEPEGKYVIFKTEDWHNLINEIGLRFTNRPDHMAPILRQAMALMVDDGVVIRRRDAFSPAPLHMYSLMMESTIAAIKKQPGGYSEQFVQHLQSRADYFHEQAMRAEEENYKIPD